MLCDQQSSVIHFYQLSQPQLNLLLRVTKSLAVECCYLEYQKIEKDDSLILSSSMKISEIKLIRDKYENLIFIIMDKKIGAYEINEFNKMGNICFIDEISHDEIYSKLENNSRNKGSFSTCDREDTLAIVSHDLKNPLNAIRLDAQILLRNCKKSQCDFTIKEIRKIATRIINTTDRLNFMVSDLLEGNQLKGHALTSLTRSKVNMGDLINEVLEVVIPLMNRNHLKIVANISENLPEIIADKNKIFQVILNLITNALKFTKSNSTVYVSLSVSNSALDFSVEDSGAGIDSDVDAKIYEKKFVGKKHKCGTGLGLYICKTIIDAHQGSIGHENRLEGGARFFFSLPLHMETNIVNSKKIYLIDDDEDLRDVLSWALNGQGYDVESFGSPLRALDYMALKTDRPSLILTDFQMHEMKLKDFLDKKLLLDLQNVPVLILTSSPKRVGEEIMKSSYNEILTKPLNLDALINTVSKYVGATDTQ